jgi:hypothetical protein
MKFFSQYDRFDLEQDIIKMFNVTELLKEFVRQYMDSERIMSEDEVANYLDGISRVHDLQCERLWDGFNLMIQNKHFEKWDDNNLPDLSAYKPTPKKGKKSEPKTAS